MFQRHRDTFRQSNRGELIVPGVAFVRMQNVFLTIVGVSGIEMRNVEYHEVVERSARLYSCDCSGCPASDSLVSYLVDRQIGYMDALYLVSRSRC